MSSNPKLSARIHLWRNPSGAVGASREDGGVHTLGLSVLDLSELAREVIFFCFHLSYAYAPSVSFICFAYSSSGTPNFLAIAT